MRDTIQVNPNIHFGKPCVAGTRIPVQDVLELVKEGISFENIIGEYYPDLEMEDIRACIEYAMHDVANTKNLTNQSQTDWERLESMSDAEIDTTDILPLTESFFNRARVFKPQSQDWSSKVEILRPSE